MLIYFFVQKKNSLKKKAVLQKAVTLAVRQREVLTVQGPKPLRSFLLLLLLYFVSVIDENKIKQKNKKRMCRL